MLLKLRAVGLDCKLVYILGKTVQDMVLDSYFQQIASNQVTLMFLTLFLKSRHLFIVFLLLTLNIAFLIKYVVEQSYITATFCLTETRLYLKLFLGFSAEPIRTPVYDIQVKYQ